MSQVYSGYTRGIVQIVPEANGNNMTNISGDVTIFINLHAIDSLGLQTNYFQSINSIQLKDILWKINLAKFLSKTSIF